VKRDVVEGEGLRVELGKVTGRVGRRRSGRVGVAKAAFSHEIGERDGALCPVRGFVYDSAALENSESEVLGSG
jgi:hypothetical protein